MKVADGVEMLEVEMDMLGTKRNLNPTLFYDDRHAVLVDAGFPGHFEAIKKAILQAGIPFEKIDGVIFTHQDIDHIGGIQELQAALGKPLEVYAYANEKPYIEGELEPIKMTKERVAEMLERVPEEIRKEMAAIYLARPTAKVTRIVADGEVLPLFGGIQVIHTPGHTPGHICLYHQPSKTLVTGDATVAEDGKILGPNPMFTPDMALAQESQQKLAKLEIERAICYHGGLCDQQVNEQILALK